MKLVTGIEAIQSGKPWREASCSKGNTRWIMLYDELGSITTSDLLKNEFIIKEEPREFWILPYAGDKHSVTEIRQDDPVDRFEKEGWIRVREVEK